MKRPCCSNPLSAVLLFPVRYTLWSAASRQQLARSGAHQLIQTDLRDINLCRRRDKLYRHLDDYFVVKQLNRRLTIAAQRESADRRTLLLFGHA